VARAVRARRCAGRRLGRGDSPRGGAGGGEVVQAARAHRARLASAGLALAAIGGVALYPALATDRLTALVAGVGGFSVLLLVPARGSRRSASPQRWGPSRSSSASSRARDGANSP